MPRWKQVKVGSFLFEREGRYKPNAPELNDLKRIDKIDFTGNFHIAEKPSNTDMILVKPGDLVISGINVAKGALGVYSGNEDVTATIHYSSYTFDEEQISVEYFKRFLKSSIFIQLLKEHVKGGIKTEIKPKHLLPLEVSLPPKHEQIEILNRFQNIESEDDELKRELNYQQTLLKKLRQQILQEAIEGKLTADWRAANPNVEPASELLKLIAAEKEQLVKDKKIKPQKLLPPIKEEEKPFDLPTGWVWCRLNHIIYEDPRNGYSPKAVDYVTETKTLKLGATTKGYFDSTEYKYINEIIDDNSYLWLEDGDILIQRSNSLDHVGISAIYDGGLHEFIYPDIMMKIKVVGPIPTPFVFNVLSSKFCREYFRKNATGAQKSMPKINQGIVSKALIALPPLDEQQEIIKKIEDIFVLCGQLETQINQNQSHAEQLMQAVLTEAFDQSAKSSSEANLLASADA